MGDGDEGAGCHHGIPDGAELDGGGGRVAQAPLRVSWLKCMQIELGGEIEEAARHHGTPDRADLGGGGC